MVSRRQNTHRVLMVRPAFFGFNEETAANNSFKKRPASVEDVTLQAQREFDTYVTLLRNAGVEVIVVQDSNEPPTPDAVFPNNWFSTHVTGELVLYPMFAPNRQLERKQQILLTIGMMPGITKIFNLSGFEKEHLYLEGTGSMCLDRVNHIVYCCASERTAEPVLNEFCAEMDYRVVFFHATDGADKPIYHTNVMMSVARDYAVVCMESIRNAAEKNALEQSFRQTGHEIVPITLEQMNHFAGNMIELTNNEGERLMVMSRSAEQCLTDAQRSYILSKGQIIAPDLHTIETIGGGSARCMIAEIFV